MIYEIKIIYLITTNDLDKFSTAKITLLVIIKCKMRLIKDIFEICPVSSDPFYIVTYYIKWVTTSWTYSIYQDLCSVPFSFSGRGFSRGYGSGSGLRERNGCGSDTLKTF